MLKVAHELRAPIAAIRSFMDLMLEGYGSPEKQRQMQKRASERAGELLNLVNDLLNLARLKEAKGTSRKQTLSLGEILTDVLSLHEPEADGRQITLDVEMNPCPVCVADGAHIKELWTNLVSNAIKYTPPGGQVTIRLFGKDGLVFGQVADTGIGIAEEDLPRLFEEFFRTDEAKAFARHGTGLGLSIAKQIVREYGGDISVESELGKGTKFTFWLPAAPLPPET
jgi:signal transduction histidine kinase